MSNEPLSYPANSEGGLEENERLLKLLGELRALLAQEMSTVR